MFVRQTQRHGGQIVEIKPAHSPRNAAYQTESAYSRVQGRLHTSDFLQQAKLPETQRKVYCDLVNVRERIETYFWRQWQYVHQRPEKHAENDLWFFVMAYGDGEG